MNGYEIGDGCMILRFLVLLLALSSTAPSFAAEPILNRLKNSFSKPAAPQPPTIKALLVNDHDGVILEVKGKYKVYDARNMELIGNRYLGKRRYLQAVKSGLIWGEEFPGVHQIAVVPDDPKTTISVDGVDYIGSVYVYDIGGTISVVNKIDIENYLSSILPGAYKLPLSTELLNAIAIAARTNAYYQSENGRSPYWDVEAQKEGYHGSAVGKRSEAFDQAVHATEYMVLNRPVKDKSEAAPFPAYWRPLGSGSIVGKGDYSKITIEDASRLAESGQDASKILEKAFPGSQIQLMFSTP